MLGTLDLINKLAMDVLVKHAEATSVRREYFRSQQQGDLEPKKPLTEEQVKKRKEISERVSDAMSKSKSKLAEFHDEKPEEKGMSGLGDLVSKTIKATTGIEGCGGCKKRQAALNKWVPFHKRKGKK